MAELKWRILAMLFFGAIYRKGWFSVASSRYPRVEVLVGNRASAGRREVDVVTRNAGDDFSTASS